MSSGSIVTVRNLELLFFSGALGWLLFEAFGKKACVECPACGGPSIPLVVTPDQGGGGDLPPGTVIDTTGIDTTESFSEPATVTSSPGTGQRPFTSTPSAYSSPDHPYLTTRASRRQAAPPPPAPADGGQPPASSAPAPTQQAPSNSQQAPPPRQAPSSQHFTPRRR